MNIRYTINQHLKQAIADNNNRVTRVTRLILSAINDKDASQNTIISDSNIITMLNDMITYKEHNITTYNRRKDRKIIDAITHDINFIKTLLPEKKNEREVEQILHAIIKESNVRTLKDIGLVMAITRARYPTKIDYSDALNIAKNLLRKT